MDALMICLLACGTATIGSRWWLLAATARRRLSSMSSYASVAITAILGSGLSAFFGAAIHAQLRGPGMLLLLALALLFAGGAMAWPVRPLSARLDASVKGPGTALILLSAAMLSDSAPFIIFAATAKTGSAAYAGIGGAIGLIAAAAFAAMADPTQPLPAWLNWLRRAIAMILFIVAVIAAAHARGLL